MKGFIKFLLISISMTSFSSTYAMTSYKCTHKGSTRTITAQPLTEGKSAPCEVRYTKESGTVETPWTAQNDGNFCEDKAKYLADRISGYGWTCELVVEKTPEPTPTPSAAPTEPESAAEENAKDEPKVEESVKSPGTDENENHENHNH